MRIGLCLVTVLIVAGCGISKEVHVAEVTHRQELEKRLEETRRELRSASEAGQAAEAELAHVRDENSDLDTQLSASRNREAELRKKLGEAEADRARLQEALSSEKGDRAAEGTRALASSRELDRLRAELTAASEETDRERAAVESERKARDLDQRALTEVLSQRDGLKAELAAEKAARAEETTRLKAEAQALTARLSALESDAAKLAEERRKVEDERTRKLDEMSRTYDGLLQGMKAEMEKGEITISRLRDRLTVNLLDEILFDSGSSKVKARGTDVLKRVGEALKGAEDKAIVIEGHTDNVALKEELMKLYPTNWELSTARATSIVRYLQDKVGIDPSRLSAVGLGPYHPVDTNDTPAGRARNRRIEIKLMPTEAPLLASPGARNSPSDSKTQAEGGPK